MTRFSSKREDVTVTFRISRELNARLRKQAEIERTTITQVLIRGIEAELNDVPPRWFARAEQSLVTRIAKAISWEQFLTTGSVGK